MRQEKTQTILLKNLIMMLAFVREYLRLLKKILKDISLLQFYYRTNIINAVGSSSISQLTKNKILVLIPHIVSSESFQKIDSIKLTRLRNTIDGLLTSFADCQIHIIISTVAERNLVAHLPDYQLQYIELRENDECDPMLVGLKSYEEFSLKINEFDWFLFIEDDIIIHDSLFLKKLQKFNDYSQDNKLVLLPHRYEFYQGKKSYIDLIIDTNLAWNKLSNVNIDGIKFAEFTNSHSGLFCLSQTQLKAWIDSGHIWQDKIIYNLPLETAATFTLFDYFLIYKPHPENLNFLEIEHYDNKYSKLLSQSSQYTIFATIINTSRQKYN